MRTTFEHALDATARSRLAETFLKRKAAAVRFGSAFVCGVGLLQGFSLHVWKERKVHQSPIDDRYRELLAVIPAGARLGWLCESSDDCGGHRFDALYALVPHVITLGPDQRLVIAEAPDARLEPLAREHGFRVAKRFRGGLALLEHP